jgi:hypothetical protein
MQINTGADYSVMSKALYDKKTSHVPLCKSNGNLKAYMYILVT